MIVKRKSSEEDSAFKDGNEDEYRERFPDVVGALRRHATCSSGTLKKRLPVLDWLPKYRREDLLSDFVAGLTVGLTAIPQGIAYAVVAGLEPQYGLYSGFMGCFVYLLFGSCKDITIGPTAIMALMVQRYVSTSPDFAILSAFLTGLIILLFGLLNLGFLVQFISMPVTAGFTSAAATTIASGQLKSLVGIRAGSSNEFIESWINFVEHIRSVQLWDTLLGVGTIVILLLLKRINGSTRWPMFCKYLSLSRNALVVIGGCLLAFVLQQSSGQIPFAVTGKVASGLPPVQLPPFETQVNGTTIGFSGMLSQLGSSLIAIPVIAILESIAIAKAFSKGKTIDANQEMIALGLCNILGSFVSSMPTTGSFTRTAVNNTSGVRTTLGGIVTGSLVLLALGLLTESFYYIPKTVLAGVIITAMIFMVDVEAAITLWRTRRMDIIPFIVTLLSCLVLGLEFGIVIGIASNILFVLYNTSRPDVTCELVNVGAQEVILVTPDQSLFFSAAEYVKYKVLKAVVTHSSTRLVVLNGHYVNHMDATMATNLKSLVDDCQLLDKVVVFWNWQPQPRGVAIRLTAAFKPLFKWAPSLDNLVEMVLSSQHTSPPEAVVMMLRESEGNGI